MPTPGMEKYFRDVNTQTRNQKRQTPQTVEKWWQEFRKTVLGDVPEGKPVTTDVNNLKAVFFAACYKLLSEVSSLLSPGEDVTQDDVMALAHIHDEVKQFLRDFPKAETK